MAKKTMKILEQDQEELSDTQLAEREAQKAEQWWLANESRKAAERVTKPLREHFIRNTGERIAGNWRILVSSSSKDVVDMEAVEAFYAKHGQVVPRKPQPQVNLDIKPIVPLADLPQTTKLPAAAK